MNVKITYDTKCRICEQLETYILRDVNVNPMDDQAAYGVMANYKEEAHRFLYCENCKKITKQEIVSFDY